MSGKISTIYIWICIFVSALCIALMIFTGKPVDDGSRQIKGESQDVQEQERSGELYVLDEAFAENLLQLSLPSGVQQHHISAENDYVNRKIKITILKTADNTEMSEDFFYENPMRGNVYIEDISVENSQDCIVMSLQMQTVFEWETKFETKNGFSSMYFQFVRPKDKYEKIIVLDAGHGGEDEGFSISAEDESFSLKEKDVALAVVKQTGAKLMEKGVQVYYTRMGDENPSQEERVSLANMVQADMLISVHGDFSDDSTLYGMRTIYNSTYFIPDFGSSDLAYLLLEKVAASTNEKALGFEADKGESYLIQNAMVPVSQVNVGYLSNKQEQKLLNKEDYILRIADGITEAAMAGYEEMKK